MKYALKAIYIYIYTYIYIYIYIYKHYYLAIFNESIMSLIALRAGFFS